MDLKDKLRRYAPGMVPRHDGAARAPVSNLAEMIRGEEAENECGRYYRTLTVYPRDYRHGNTDLHLVRDIEPSTFGLVGKDAFLSRRDFTSALFLDTETTGLAGGTGTVPFLVGLGYFSDDGFRVEQFFMRDFHEEAAVLLAVADRMGHSEVLVSYNGKAYDMNVLTTRYILSRMENPAVDMPHLDLLFTARRLWRRRLADCSLTNIERNVLDYHREGDIPSFLIPQMYFDYLRSRDARRLAPVFRHNRWDIVTLAALAGRAGRIFENPSVSLRHGQDLLSLGRAFRSLYRPGDAIVCFREALNHSLPREDREEALLQLGRTLKRMGRWEEAAEVWKAMIDEPYDSMHPYEELAKHLEHRTKNYGEAMHWVNRALERLAVLEALSNLRMTQDRRNLEHRRERLRRKLGDPGSVVRGSGDGHGGGEDRLPYGLQ